MRLRIISLLSLLLIIFSAFTYILSQKEVVSADTNEVYSEWNVDGDGAIRKNLTNINVADTSIMQINTDVKVFGNIVSFGPSIGAFVSYSTKGQHQNVRIETEMCFNSQMPNWQRVVLRGDEISAARTGGTNGYFISLEKDAFILYKQVEGTYIILHYGAWNANNLGQSTLYDGNYHKFVFEIFDRTDGSVVINIGVNEKSCLHLVDSINKTTDFFDKEIASKNRVSYAGKGYVGFYMNSTGSAWYMKGDFNSDLFDTNVLLGDETLYSSNSTADIKTGEISFDENESAILQEDYSNLAVEFTMNAKNSSQTGEIIALSAFNGKVAARSYSTLDGIVAIIYSNKIEFKLNGSVVKTINDLNLLNSNVNIKVITTYVSGEFLFGIGIDNTWYTYSTKDIVNTIGYFGIYSFTKVDLSSKAKEDGNYRVLVIGNSITNHSPLASLNYGIGSNGGETWGMATSSPETDYSHRVIAGVREIEGYEDAELLAVNMASWEANISSFEYVNTYQNAADFKADLIVIKLGENAATHSPDYTAYANSLNNLINYLKTNENAKVIICTEYWGSSSYLFDVQVDMGNIKVARDNGYSLVRLNDLGTVNATTNNASADGEYYRGLTGTAPSGKTWYEEWSGWTSDVKQHPGMVGHENIAARIVEEAKRLITGSGEEVNKYEELADGIYAEYSTSNLYGNVPGAYDYKGNTKVEATEITTGVNENFAKNYVLYKAFNLNHDGDIYRIEIEGDDDTNASYTFKAYTTKNNQLKELVVFVNSDIYRDGFISIVGDFGDKLYICVEYNVDNIFADNTLSESKYGPILKLINKDNANLILDLTSKEAKTLTISNLCFPIITSSGKDVEIKLAQGSFIIDRKTFETISKTTDNLFFSIQKFTAINYLRNSSTIISSMVNEYGEYSPIHTDDNGYLTDVYEVQISYNGRSGNALYVNSGITANINIDIEKQNCIQVISAVLPTLGSKYKNVEVLDDNRYSYSNNTLSISVKDFDSDIIVCYKSVEEKLILEEIRSEVIQGNGIDTSSIVLKYQHKNGTLDNITVNSSMITGFDSNKAGEQTITITYSGKTITAKITVLENGKKKGCGSNLSMSLVILLACFMVVYCAKKVTE